MIRGKAYRRHAARRKLNRVLYIVRRIWWCPGDDPGVHDEFARRHFDHWPACSCLMCGNPHKYNELTRQEKLAIIDERDQLDQLNQTL